MKSMCRQCSAPAVARGLCGRCLKRPKYMPLDNRPGRKNMNKRRGVGYGPEWRRASRSFLRRNPLCMACARAGRATPATVVDHILPVETHPELKLVETNFQSLCATRPHSCHQRKTAREYNGEALDFRNGQILSFVDKLR